MSVLLIAGGGRAGRSSFPPNRAWPRSQENIPANERSEEYATVGRFDHVRQIKLEQRRSAIIFEFPLPRIWGTRKTVCCSRQAAIVSPTALLAPLTC